MSICQEELHYLVKSNSLFGRKFEEGCRGLENLLDMFYTFEHLKHQPSPDIF